MQKTALLFFAVTFIVSHTLYAAALNTTGIAHCEAQFFTCAWGNATSTSNCTVPFKECMSKFAYLPSNKTQDCYLAESAWTNLGISVWFSISVFLFSNLIFPGMLKATAKGITAIGAYDLYEHPFMGKLGRFLLYVTDGDGDGRVTAPELIAPQTIFSFSSIALPVYQWFTANDAQAKCDYQKAN